MILDCFGLDKFYLVMFSLFSFQNSACFTYVTLANQDGNKSKHDLLFPDLLIH